MIRFNSVSTHLRKDLAAAAFVSLAILLTVATAQAQSFTVLHAFTNKGDGGYPYSGLFLDETGIFYGATEGGGSYGYGTVFKMDSAGKDKVLHSFWGLDGVGPHSKLIRDKAGNLYGTAMDGGTPEGGGCYHGCGTVFKLAPNGKATVLYVFTGGADGGEPQAPLTLDNSGNLYGTTTIGGDLNCRTGLGCGVIFKLDPKGKQTVLHSFTGSPHDGWYPSGGLLAAKNGGFYGVTWFGGTSDYGTIYKMTSSGKVTILYSFQGLSTGEYPNSPIVRDSQGNFYGTTTNGGKNNDGTVFKVDKHGNGNILHSFAGGSDGYAPYTGLTRDNAGNLYGVTIWGGGSSGCYSLGCGTIFKIDSSGHESVLYAFTGTTDGNEPEGTLILDSAGNLYGTAPGGGDPVCRYGGCGTVFELTP